ncbi:MAG: hypothetical protein QM736_20805 [Vicinamibacterales bacterium]
MLAAGELRDDDAGDIRCGEQHNKKCDSCQERQEHTNVEARRLHQREHDCADMLIRIGMFHRQLMRDVRQFGCCVVHRDTCFEASRDEDHMLGAALTQVIDDERREEIGISKDACPRRLREDANHGVRYTVEQERVPHDISTPRELTLPGTL